jgi:hypothetical protein
METKMNITGLKNRAWILICGCLVSVFSCQLGSDSEAGFTSGEGTGGSTARFTIAGNNLYTVDHYSLKIFNIEDPQHPQFIVSRPVGFGIETIFPLHKNLYLGTSTGMYIYDIDSPENPQKISYFEHVISCDPVVSDGKYAYVTLSSGNQRCRRGTNELQIIDLQNLKSPALVKQYPLTQPRGLAIRNDTLWICDNGLKGFDVSNKQDIKLLFNFSDISAYDVILNNHLILITGETGFVQYSLANNSIRKLSEIKIKP